MANQSVKYLSTSATATAASGRASYYGYVVTVVTAVAALQIRDSLTAGTGTVIDTIPIGTAIGSVRTFPFPISCNLGLTFDLNGGTGGITLLYEGQK